MPDISALAGVVVKVERLTHGVTSETRAVGFRANKLSLPQCCNQSLSVTACLWCSRGLGTSGLGILHDLSRGEVRI